MILCKKMTHFKSIFINCYERDAGCNMFCPKNKRVVLFLKIIILGKSDLEIYSNLKTNLEAQQPYHSTVSVCLLNLIKQIIIIGKKQVKSHI